MKNITIDTSRPKQNLLCNNLSPKEVMFNHDDFAKKSQISNFTDRIRHPDSFEVAKPDASVGFLSPKFKFVLPSLRNRVILVIDLSQAMGRHHGGIGKWEKTRNALFRFFSHVPEGTEVGIVTFGAKAKVNIEPTVVTPANRHGLFGKIPFRLLEDGEGCIDCGLKIGHKLLNLPHAAESQAENASGRSGSIVLVTATEVVRPGSLNELRKEVNSDALPIFTIGYRTICDDVNELTKFGGNFVANADSDKLLQNVADIFLAIINKISVRTNIKKSYEQDYVWTGEGIISGNFEVEENRNKNLWMILTSPFKEDVELFEVTSPSGNKFVFPKYEYGLVYFHRKGLNEIGVWSYRARLYSTAARSTRMTIEVISEATPDDSVDLSAWTSVKFDGIGVTDNPVILYAQLRQGPLPVRDAKVVALVQRPGMDLPVEVVLRDEGTGYPDITKGDGIYTAYFVDFTTEPGLYSVTVRATDNSGRASLPKPSGFDVAVVSTTIGDQGCCGSSMAKEMYSMPTSSFVQHVAVSGFKITDGIQFFMSTNNQPQRADIFPPSRVTDLAVQNYVNQTLYATLTWSAPGGDFNMGKAAKYAITCYTKPEALTDQNFGNISIPVHESLLPEPAEYSTKQTATVGLPWANEVFYYGLIAIDEAGNRSPVSNLIPVYAAEVTTTTNASFFDGSRNGLGSLDSAFSTAVQALSTNGTAYLVVGIVLGLVFIVVLIILTSICRARNRKRAELKRAKNQRTQIFVNDIETPQDLAEPEKSVSYGGVWTVGGVADAGSSTSGGNHSPSSEYSNEYNLYKNVQNLSMSDQASWAYISSTHQPQQLQPKMGLSSGPQFHHPNAVPVHEAVQGQQPTPTYQNWTKPPSDNGTATTSSTECSESDQSEKNQAASTIVVTKNSFSRRFSTDDGTTDYPSVNGSYHPSPGSVDPATLSLSPSFVSEKRRRQESLV